MFLYCSCPLTKLLFNCVQYFWEIFYDIFIFKTYNIIPHISQPFCSELIFFYLLVFRMISSIYLYDKLLFNTNEIYDIIPDYVLFVEFDG